MRKSLLAIAMIICLSLGMVFNCRSYIVRADDGPQDGFYIIASVQDPSRCVDVDNFGTANGTKVQLWENKTGTPGYVCNQYVYIHRESDGTYTIRLSYSTDVYLHIMCEEPATYVHCWCGTGINARWRFYRVEGKDVEKTARFAERHHNGTDTFKALRG